MIVNWKGTGVFMVPASDPGQSEIRTTGANDIAPARKIGGEKMVKLIPGYNEVLDPLWEKAVRHVEHYIKSGKIEEMGKEDTDEAGNKFMKSFPIRKIVPEMAKEVVKGCFNVDTLKFWLTGSDTYDHETRDEIRALIKEQVEKIMEDKLDTVGTLR